MFADAGFPALATPSAGVAASLGYEDGSTPPDEMFAAVARIVRAVQVPVSADIEDGYGLPPKELVSRLLDTGAVDLDGELYSYRGVFTTARPVARRVPLENGPRLWAGALYIDVRRIRLREE